MAKISRRDLARGTKLTAQHWSDATQGIASALNGVTIEPENLELNNGSFSLTFNWPRLPAYAFQFQPTYPGADPNQLVVPFVLPPTQDLWNEGKIGDETPMPVLRSISVSLDTGMGPNGVTDTWDTDGGLNDSVYLNASADIYDIDLTIRTKDQAYVYGLTSDPIYHSAKKFIFEQSISGLLFAGDVQQFNPVFIDGIDEVIDPFKTYLMGINFPKIWAGKLVDEVQKRFSVSSLTIKLNFEGPILRRDAYDPEENPIQNVPVFADGGQAGMSVSIDTPTADSLITARTGVAGNGRLQQNAETLDAVVLGGLPAGRDPRGVTGPEEPISHDTGYTVIAVPMFGGWNDIRSEDINRVGLPYGDQNNPAPNVWNGSLQDRRLIPISQSFVVHQVIAVHNYASPKIIFPSYYPSYNGLARPYVLPAGPNIWQWGTLPTSPTFTSEIGVGICTGLRADAKQYEQVAFVSYTPDTKALYEFDRCKPGVEAPFFGGDQTLTNNYELALMQVPLVSNVLGGRGTRGYADQGFPYYVGKSGLATRARRSVGVVGAPGTTRTPNTAGGELFLEVRWKMSDVNGLNSGATGDPNPAGTTYVGMGGHWIYIIGKMEVATTSAAVK